jgi:hypothetical protein
MTDNDPDEKTDKKRFHFTDPVKAMLGLSSSAERAADQIVGLTQHHVQHQPVTLNPGDTVSFTHTFTTVEGNTAGQPGDVVFDPKTRTTSVVDADGNLLSMGPTYRAGGCKECGDPSDHNGQPHSHVVGWAGGKGVRGARPQMMVMDELSEWGQAKPMPLLRGALGEVLSRKPSLVEIHSDDHEWFKREIAGKTVLTKLDAEGPGSANVVVNEAVEPGSIRVTFWLPERSIYPPFAHMEETVDVVIR